MGLTCLALGSLCMKSINLIYLRKDMSQWTLLLYHLILFMMSHGIRPLQFFTSGILLIPRVNILSNYHLFRCRGEFLGLSATGSAHAIASVAYHLTSSLHHCNYEVMFALRVTTPPTLYFIKGVSFALIFMYICLDYSTIWVNLDDMSHSEGVQWIYWTYKAFLSPSI